MKSTGNFVDLAIFGKLAKSGLGKIFGRMSGFGRFLAKYGMFTAKSNETSLDLSSVEWFDQGGHKPGILSDFSVKNCNKKYFSSSFKYLCRTAVDWVNRIIRDEIRVLWWPVILLELMWTLMKVIITFTFCCDNLWKSKFMAREKPGKLREFFSPTLWPPCWRFATYILSCSSLN